MATLIFYQRILYSRGWSCVSQHLRNISKPFFNARRLFFFWRCCFVSCGGALSTDCGCELHSLFGCVPPLDTSPLASSEGLGLSPGAWGAPKRGMPTGSEAFLELPITLGFGPATGPTLKTALCHIRTLVGRRINTALFFLAMLLCVLWWGALDRLWLRAAQSVRVCSTTGYITSGLRGPSPRL